jgi:hypothetical protein
MLNPMKIISSALLFTLIVNADLKAQNGKPSCYDNFEGQKCIYYHEKNGVLDTSVVNPFPSVANSSDRCAMYVRNESKKFDNIKMSVRGKLANVSSYATYLGTPPELKMKIYTTAPPGTLVEILLGSKGRNNEYPAGTNSQYQAHTTMSNAWEEITFKFAQVPQGSETSFSEVDQVTLLFNPNSNTSDTYYFDEITGPSIAETTEAPVKKEGTQKKVMDKNSPRK